MSEIDDFLTEARATQHVAYYAAEHDRTAAAQAYATIALAQAVIALVERMDRITDHWLHDDGADRYAIKVVNVGV